MLYLISRRADDGSGRLRKWPKNQRLVPFSYSFKSHVRCTILLSIRGADEHCGFNFAQVSERYPKGSSGSDESSMADSIILATAQAEGATLWTQDAHFREIDGVRSTPAT